MIIRRHTSKRKGRQRTSRRRNSNTNRRLTTRQSAISVPRRRIFLALTLLLRVNNRQQRYERKVHIQNNIQHTTQQCTT